MLTLRHERFDIAASTFPVEETGTGEPLESQLTPATGRHSQAPPSGRGIVGAPSTLWVFASETSAFEPLHAPTAPAGGAGFSFHADGQPGWPVERASTLIYANRRDYQWEMAESTFRPKSLDCPPPVTASSSPSLSLLPGGITRCAVVSLSS